MQNQLGLPTQASPNQLCESCAEIPFKVLFQQGGEDTTVRHKLGQISDARISQASCCFCWFLVQIYERIYGLFLSQDAGTASRGKKTMYLVKRSAKPWFDVAGIQSKLPLSSTLWLQFTEARDSVMAEPYICISQLPTPSDNNANECIYPNIYALPRERSEKEANTGLLDYHLICDWFKICEEQHTTLCRRGVNFKRYSLKTKFIDVENNEIVLDPGNENYVALSYVWGRSPSFNTDTVFNGKLPKVLPRTVADAIRFMRKLKLKYLWVDRYCIDERSEAEKTSQIEAMDLIYECAYLTLIALDGDNMEAGLSGISRPMKYTYQPKVETQHGKFMATFVDSMWDNQGNTPHDFRAWTLQEGILSWRSVYFDKSHVYMRCQEEMFHGALEADTRLERVSTYESETNFWDNGFGLTVYEKDWHFHTLDSLLANYTRRQLTLQSDALNACKGLLNQITRNTGAGFIWGHPHVDFCQSLLWKPWSGNCIKRRSHFPSWSWLGWEGRTEYNYWLSEIDDYSQKLEDRSLVKGIEAKTTQIQPSSESLTKHNVRQDNEAFIPTKGMTENSDGHFLRVSSTIAWFGVRMVRKRGEVLADSKRNGSPERTAEGDQWTITDRKGRPLENAVGENDTAEIVSFEKTDYFFSLHPACSRELQKAGSDAEFLFIKHWPAIRDHHKSDNWLFDMVSALLIIRNDDDSARRVSSVIMKCEDWLAAYPLPALVNLC